MSKRSWQTEIIQDHLEEAEEMFEVTLVSPEGTVIGINNKAQITIRDSGRGTEIVQIVETNRYAPTVCV